MSRFQLLGLLLALAACQAPSASDQHFQRLLREERPAVVQELGLDVDAPWLVAERADIRRPFEVWILIDGRRAFCYRPEWVDLPADIVQLCVAHELAHLCGPHYKRHAIAEGLADVITTRVHPRAQAYILFDHWTKGPENRKQPIGPLIDIEDPATQQEDQELRAVGFMLFYCMSREELQEFVATGQSAIIDELRQLTVEELWARAAHAPQPKPLAIEGPD